MKFAVAIVAPKGPSLPCKWFDRSEVLARVRAPGWVDQFAQVFRQKCRPRGDGCDGTLIHLDESRDIWVDLFQPLPFLALATAGVAGQAAWYLNFLSGHFRELETLQMTGLAKVVSGATCQAIEQAWQSLKERPLTLWAPCGRMPANVETGELIDWLLCLALAYFEYADDAWAAMPELHESHEKNGKQQVAGDSAFPGDGT